MKKLTYTELEKIEEKGSRTFTITDPRALTNAQRSAYKWAQSNGLRVKVSMDWKRKTITVTRL